MSTDIIIQLVTAVIVGSGAGYVGSLMVLRRMSLVGDALSHVALPGLAVALLVGINPLIGAFTVLLAAVVGVWYLQERTALPTETLVGVFFTTSLAVGLLLTPEHELLEALFGDITRASVTDVVISFGAVLMVLTLLSRITRPLILSTISQDLARTNGVATGRVHFLFLLVVAVIVGLGIRVTGTILTGALVIIPAATARNITRSLASYTTASSMIGALTAGAGVMLSTMTPAPAGPLIILAAGFVFVTSLYVRR